MWWFRVSVATPSLGTNQPDHLALNLGLVTCFFAAQRLSGPWPRKLCRRCQRCAACAAVLVQASRRSYTPAALTIGLVCLRTTLSFCARRDTVIA